MTWNRWCAVHKFVHESHEIWLVESIHEKHFRLLEVFLKNVIHFD